MRSLLLENLIKITVTTTYNQVLEIERKERSIQHFPIEVRPIVMLGKVLQGTSLHFTMSGRGGRSARGGCGGHSRTYQGCGRRRWGNYYSGVRAEVKHEGLCAALSNPVFDSGAKEAADQMRTTWEKIVHHVGAIYGQDISNKLQQNKKTVIIT
jgi:hypothetical protein